MSSRLRSLDSKISFFAFADIITAVSGVLIFVALLLATDLGRPTASRSPATSAAEQKLQNTLAQQAEVDAENERLEELLATAETSPDPAKLQADIASLRAQLTREREKQAALESQLSASKAALAARDRALGLTDLNAAVTRLLATLAATTSAETTAHETVEHLRGEVDHAASQLLKLHQRENQIWLIPEKSLTAKEPVLVTVARANAIVDRFNRPDLRQQFGGDNVNAAFTSYLHHLNTNAQYLVFLIKPSGVLTFHNMVESARNLGFEVGYDALEENRVVHFDSPPPLDETIPATTESPDSSEPGSFNTRGGGVTGGKSSSGQGSDFANGADGNNGSERTGGGFNGSTIGPGGYGGSAAGSDSGSASGTGGNGGSPTGSGGNGRSANGTGDHNGSAATPGSEGNSSGSSRNGSAGTTGSTNNSHATTTTGTTPPPAKSWWQRLLEWLGIK